MDEETRFILSEIVEQQHIPTKEELIRQKQHWWAAPPKWDYKSSGRLRLALEGVSSSHVRKVWADGKVQRLSPLLAAHALTAPARTPFTAPRFPRS
ncbi:MAG: hypothetical protein ACRD3I_06425, partial [Terriglobales bacterium]